MIIDETNHLNRYDIPFRAEIQAFLKSRVLREIPDGEIPLAGRDLFLRIGSYAPRLHEDLSFETHQVYADVQVIASGEEIIQTAWSADLVPLGPYDPVKDVQFFQAEKRESSIVLREGDMAVFWPGEAHKPGCLFATGKPVKKLVFKIRMGESHGS